MCQAIWRSPLLPLEANTTGSQSHSVLSAIGSGARFKRDLLLYLDAYGTKKTGSLVNQLKRFNFDAIRAALVASTPSKQKVSYSGRSMQWGWPALQEVLSHIPVQRQETETDIEERKQKTPHIVIQVSQKSRPDQTRQPRAMH